VKSPMSASIISALVLLAGTTMASTVKPADADLENLMRRSYPHVAMYNGSNKFAQKQGGWNTCDADIGLKDHTTGAIARPNDGTLYITCLLDLRQDPVGLEIPAFDSKYVSSMITGYDHDVRIPMATRVGDFRKPGKTLIDTVRSEGYNGEPVEGVDRPFAATGDFVSAALVSAASNQEGNVGTIGVEAPGIQPIPFDPLHRTSSRAAGSRR